MEWPRRGRRRRSGDTWLINLRVGGAAAGEYLICLVCCTVLIAAFSATLSVVCKYNYFSSSYDANCVKLSPSNGWLISASPSPTSSCSDCAAFTCFITTCTAHALRVLARLRVMSSRLLRGHKIKDGIAMLMMVYNKIREWVILKDVDRRIVVVVCDRAHLSQREGGCGLRRTSSTIIFSYTVNYKLSLAASRGANS